MARPLRMLDLFCGAGGAAYGYWQGFKAAGYDLNIIGVDIAPQPHYPFTFQPGDAMSWPLDEYDFVHASPPCQEYSVSRYLRNATCPAAHHRSMLVVAVYERLRQSAIPWVIENVEGAPMPDSILLCGSMFGLPIRRHRLFAASVLLFAPHRCHHLRNDACINVVGGKVRGYGELRSDHRYCCVDGTVRKRESCHKKSVGQEAMQIDWMTIQEMSEAVPPAYTEWIARQLAQVIA